MPFDMVYDPAEDTHLLAKNCEQHAYGDALDIGSGNGEQAAAALRNRRLKSVVCADIDPEAIKHLKRRFKEDKRAKVTQSDLFSNIKGSFDTIMFNPPYLPQDHGIEDKQIYGGKKGNEIILRFIEGMGDHLKTDGIVLLLWSSLSRPEEIMAHLSDQLYSFEKIDSMHISFEDLYVYRIWKSDLRKDIERAGVTGLAHLANGKRGAVYSGRLGGKKVAIKAINPKSKATLTIEKEAKMLASVNKHRIGPKLLHHDTLFNIMEFIQGERIIEFVLHADKKSIKRTLLSCLEQCFTLDEMGIDKEEMHHPRKHILVRRGKPVMIDFERAHHRPDTKNVTQFAQFLAGPLNDAMLAQGIQIGKEEIRRLASEYKEDRANISKIIAYIKAA